MPIFGPIKAFLKMADRFGTPDLLRYKSSSDYRTACGGFFTIAFIAVIVLTFVVQIIDCFYKR